MHNNIKNVVKCFDHCPRRSTYLFLFIDIFKKQKLLQLEIWDLFPKIKAVHLLEIYQFPATLP